MILKKYPILATLLITVVIILIAAVFKGCYENNGVVAKYKKLDSLNSVLLDVVADSDRELDSTKKAFNDSLEFERGQKELAKAQLQRTAYELDAATKTNKELIAKYKLAKYTDTSTVTVPHEFVADCHDCFTNLEKTTNQVDTYRTDVSRIQNSWNKQEALYQKRFKEIEIERLGFNNKIRSLAKQQQEYIDKLKPHGRLYLSWGVLFQPWPKYAGVGLMYQNKRNLIWGAMWYYGDKGHVVQTIINFPLSLKFR